MQNQGEDIVEQKFPLAQFVHNVQGGYIRNTDKAQNWFATMTLRFLQKRVQTNVTFPNELLTVDKAWPKTLVSCGSGYRLL